MIKTQFKTSKIFKWLSFSMVILLTRISRTQAQSRCEYLCQNDGNCRKGLCVLTYCIDTPACYNYCFQCYDQEKCQQSGPYCDALTAADYFSYYLLKSYSPGLLHLNYYLFAFTLILNCIKIV